MATATKLNAAVQVQHGHSDQIPLLILTTFESATYRGSGKPLGSRTDYTKQEKPRRKSHSPNQDSVGGGDNEATTRSCSLHIQLQQQQHTRQRVINCHKKQQALN